MNVICMHCLRDVGLEIYCMSGFYSVPPGKSLWDNRGYVLDTNRGYGLNLELSVDLVLSFYIKSVACVRSNVIITIRSAINGLLLTASHNHRISGKSRGR